MSDTRCNVSCKCFREALMDAKPFHYCAAIGKKVEEGAFCTIQHDLKEKRKSWCKYANE